MSSLLREREEGKAMGDASSALEEIAIVTWYHRSGLLGQRQNRAIPGCVRSQLPGLASEHHSPHGAQ